MFFIGLLSTPLPYLLLAGFYFVGFAMGIFQNSTDDQIPKPIASITIEHEVIPSLDHHSAFYYVAGAKKVQIQSQSLPSDQCVLALFPNPGTIHILQKNAGIQDLIYYRSRFSRPPPSSC